MRIPINHTMISPSPQLSSELSRLSSIAALAHVIGQWQLKEQAIEAHDKLVESYNRQLSVEKPKGFWRKFIENLTFSDLDTTIVYPVEKLRDSKSLSDNINFYAQFSQEDITEFLYKLINREL